MSEQDQVDAVAIALCRTLPHLSTWHYPGDEPRPWDGPGGGTYTTHPLTERSAASIRKAARAAIAAMTTPAEAAKVLLGAMNVYYPETAKPLFNKLDQVALNHPDASAVETFRQSLRAIAGEGAE